MLRMIIRRLLGAARLTTMRMQQPIPSASKLASGLAADPQHYMRDKQRKITLESLHGLLTRAAKLLDKAAGEIWDLPLEPTRNNIQLIGESLSNIHEIKQVIYKAKPELIPEFLKEVPSYPREQGRALTKAMAISYDEEEKGNIRAAVTLLEDFLATKPDERLTSVAEFRIDELRKKYGI
jgi:hypothetical protein